MIAGGNFLLAGVWNAFADTAWNWLKTPINRWLGVSAVDIQRHSPPCPYPVDFHSKRIAAGGTGAHREDRVSDSDKSRTEIDRVNIINNSRLDKRTAWICTANRFCTRIRFLAIAFLTLMETLRAVLVGELNITSFGSFFYLRIRKWYGRKREPV